MKYKVSLWLKPDLEPEQIKKEVKLWEEFLKGKEAQGGLLKTENQGRKKLAYKIKGLSEGYFLNLELDVLPSAIADFKVFLNRQASVLRYLLMKLKV